MIGEEEKIEKLQEGRVLRLAFPVLMPILARRKEQAVARLVGQFRGGETNFLTTVAELTTLTDLEQEMTRKHKETELLEGEFYGSKKPKP